jgi:hypothetical protein
VGVKSEAGVKSDVLVGLAKTVESIVERRRCPKYKRGTEGQLVELTEYKQCTDANVWKVCVVQVGHQSSTRASHHCLYSVSPEDSYVIRPSTSGETAQRPRMLSSQLPVASDGVV